MTLIVLLFVVGIVLIGVEVIVPGGILGVLGGLSMVGGVALTFADYGSSAGLTAATGSLIVGAAVLYWEFIYLPKSGLIRKVTMATTVSGRSQPELAKSEEVVGQTGVTLTVLSPSGYVQIAGKRYEAFSRQGRLAEGQTVQVVGLDTFRLIVTPIESPLL